MNGSGQRTTSWRSAAAAAIVLSVLILSGPVVLHPVSAWFRSDLAQDVKTPAAQAPAPPDAATNWVSATVAKPARACTGDD